MKRREFIASSIAAAAGASALASDSLAQTPSRPMPQFYELRQYHLRTTMRQDFSDYLKDVSVPGAESRGHQPGWRLHGDVRPREPNLLAAAAAQGHRLGGLARRQAAGRPGVQDEGRRAPLATGDDPGYVRIDSQLMVAFDGMPTLEAPAGANATPSRVFELRTYESHSKAAHRKKMEMFNTGEIGIFRRTGLAPVFFGSNIVAQRMPSLTYMLVFADMAAREELGPVRRRLRVEDVVDDAGLYGPGDPHQHHVVHPAHRRRFRRFEGRARAGARPKPGARCTCLSVATL